MACEGCARNASMLSGGAPKIDGETWGTAGEAGGRPDVRVPALAGSKDTHLKKGLLHEVGSSGSPHDVRKHLGMAPVVWRACTRVGEPGTIDTWRGARAGEA